MSVDFEGRPKVLRAWSTLPVGEESRSAPPGRRERLVDSISRTMHGTRARELARRRARHVASALALAAGLVLVVGLWRARAANETPVARLYTLFGASHALVGGHVLPSPAASAALSLAPKAEIETESASSSRLQLVSGVEVAVGPETRLKLPDALRGSGASEEMALEGGFVRVHVPKLRSGSSFAIRTPNTLVVVHGTSFSVEVTKTSPASVPRTKVVVTEGVVTVQQGGRDVLLGAGMEWTSENPPDARGVSAVAPSLAQSPPAVDGAEGADTAARSGASSQTELAHQNRLFAQAMRAKDQGDSARALRLLADLFQRYPDAPLAQDAHVEQFRVLAAMGSRAAASRAALTYLSRYPNGFASDEARRLLPEPRGVQASSGASVVK